MSVDYYDCSCCGSNGVYEEYITHCCECGELVCSDCVINTPNDFNYPFIGKLISSDGGLDPKYCPFCSGDKISHKQIVRYLLDKYNLSEEEVIKEILNERRNDS